MASRNRRQAAITTASADSEGLRKLLLFCSGVQRKGRLGVRPEGEEGGWGNEEVDRQYLVQLVMVHVAWLLSSSS